MGKPARADNDIFTDEDVAEERRSLTVIDDAFNVRVAVKDKNSPLAKVLAAALEDARQANLALIVCDPANLNRIRELQWRVTRYHDLVGYARNIVEAGKIEQEDLSGEEQTAIARLLGHDDQQMKDV